MNWLEAPVRKTFEVESVDLITKLLKWKFSASYYRMVKCHNLPNGRSRN